MAGTIDPLSPATRAAKRNLLVASMLSITYSAFNVMLGGLFMRDGIKIGDPRAVTFLLVASLAYFLVSFVIYATVDYMNAVATPHQEDVEGGYALARMRTVQQVADRTLRQLQRWINSKYGSGLYDLRGGEEELLERLQLMDEDNWQAGISLYSHAREVVDKMTLYSWRDRSEVAVSEDRERYSEMISLVERALGRFKTYQQFYVIPVLPKLIAVRALYLARDSMDTVLPPMVAVLGLAALLQQVDLRFIADLIPLPPAFRDLCLVAR